MSNRGVALIEVLVSVALIGTGLVVIIRALDTCVRTADHSRQRTVALRLLDETLDEAVQSERLTLTTPVGGPFETPFDLYSYRWEMNAIEESPFVRVIATVEWQRSGRTMELTGGRLAAR